jgi:fluoroquinolone transport system permease protein
MSHPFATLLVHETRLQYRYGIYVAYAFVVAFYVAVLIWGGAYLPPGFIAFIVYTDPSVLGFFFLGALMMLEKAEGARLALSITPVSARDYFFAKAVPLTAFGLLAVAVLAPFVHGEVNWPLLLAAVLLTSLAYIGIGVPIALRFRTVTSYLIGSAGLLLPVILPAFLAFLDPMPVWAMLVPTAAQLRLITIGVGAANDTAGAIILMFVMTGLGTIGGIWLGLKRLDREIGRK